MVKIVATPAPAILTACSLVLLMSTGSSHAAEPFGFPHGEPEGRHEQARPGSHSMTIEIGSGRMIHLSGAASNIFAANPKVAEVRPASPDTLFVFGLAEGRTSVAAVDETGRTLGQYLVTVVPSGYAAGRVHDGIQDVAPGADVAVQPSESGVVVAGSVPTPADADRVMMAARSQLGANATIDDRLRVATPIQVLLRVRVAEMSRTLTRDLGLNWRQLGGDLGAVAQVGLQGFAGLADAPGGIGATAQLITAFRNTSVEGVVDALAEDQLIHTLAEPNLTAMSGETASFLVGGEYPIPVSQQLGETTVEYKQYGISLSFVPTVMSNGRINLRVRPEVSALTNQGAVTLQSSTSSLVIPALTVRRVETTVELGSGESFAIAGLLQDQVTQEDQGTPFLGDVPILGALFRSDSFRRQQSELVILVTPYIVRPTSAPAALHLAGENYRAPGDLDRLLLLKQNATGVEAGSHTPIPGNAGFLLE